MNSKFLRFFNFDKFEYTCAFSQCLSLITNVSRFGRFGNVLSLPTHLCKMICLILFVSIFFIILFNFTSLPLEILKVSKFFNEIDFGKLKISLSFQNFS